MSDIVGARPRGVVALGASAGGIDALQRAGHVHVAAPDRHLTVTRGFVALDAGPKENGARPAIDPLFRSMAFAYGRRGAAVVLSGALTDGSLGAAAVATAGGT